jgi:outer membrane protein
MMKQFHKIKTSLVAVYAAALLCLPAASMCAETAQQFKVGVIDFKECVERSKMGKDEQASFEALKKQAEQVLQDKEKQLKELAAKIEDPDYMDSLTADAEAELKHKFRYLSQEMQQQQQMLYQSLSQANYKVVQKLQEEVNKAAETLAKEKKIDLIINDDACFYYGENLDLTDDVIRVLDSKTSK